MAMDMIGREATNIGDDTSDDGSGSSTFADIMGTIGQGMAVAQQVGSIAVQGVAAANTINHIVNTPPHVVAAQMVSQARAMLPRPAPPMLRPTFTPSMAPGGLNAGPAMGAAGANAMPITPMLVAPPQHSWLWPLLGVGGGGATGAGIGWLAAHAMPFVAVGGLLGATVGGMAGYLFNRFHVSGSASLNTKAGSIGLSVAKA